MGRPRLRGLLRLGGRPGWVARSVCAGWPVRLPFLCRWSCPRRAGRLIPAGCWQWPVGCAGWFGFWVGLAWGWSSGRFVWVHRFALPGRFFLAARGVRCLFCVSVWSGCCGRLCCWRRSVCAPGSRRAPRLFCRFWPLGGWPVCICRAVSSYGSCGCGLWPFGPARWLCGRPLPGWGCSCRLLAFWPAGVGQLVHPGACSWPRCFRRGLSVWLGLVAAVVAWPLGRGRPWRVGAGLAVCAGHVTVGIVLGRCDSPGKLQRRVSVG